jgi:hypothetical protein
MLATCLQYLFFRDYHTCLVYQFVMSIPAKRRRLQGVDLAGERHHSESPTNQTPTTATDRSASTALTPLTAMDIFEPRQDEPKSAAEAVEEEQLELTPESTRESSWQGWAELENDPVGATASLVLSII